MAATKRCEICKTRPITTDSPESQLCTPCLREAEWENTHGDHSHEAIRTFDTTLTAPRDCETEGCDRVADHKGRHGVETKADAKARETYRQYASDFYANFTGGGRGVAAERETMEGCWICYPELNRASAEYTPRNGSSREGMRMTVRRGQAPQEKAALVALAIEGTGHGSAKVTTRKGVTTLKGTIGDTPVELRWEGRSFVAGRFNGRAVRNVSEALRLVAA
jgi:hypothetical protein